MEDIKQTLVDLAQKAWDANIKDDAGFYRNFLIDEAVGVNNFGIVDKVSLVKQMEHLKDAVNLSVPRSTR